MSEGLTIVVADDDHDILNLVTRFLRKKDGTEVLATSEGTEALKLVRKNKPNLVVLDVMMPGMSGWEVCRAIREDDELAGTKVVMMTGIGERLNALTSPLYGAHAYVDKPFELDDLSAAVEKALAAD